jgi:hypothetical protein
MVPEICIQKLRLSLRVPVFSPDEQACDTARTLPTTMIDRGPGSTAGCAGGCRCTDERTHSAGARRRRIVPGELPMAEA